MASGPPGGWPWPLHNSTHGHGAHTNSITNEELQNAIEVVYTLHSAVFIFVMQAGFALVEGLTNQQDPNWRARAHVNLSCSMRLSIV